MTTDNWDFDAQQAATRYTVAQLISEKNVPENAEISLELFFVAVENAETELLLKALKTFGYDAEPEQETLEGGETRTAILITIDKTKMSADNIWTHEERTTKLALSRGFVPDGWGFVEP